MLHLYVHCTSKLWARKGLWNRFQDSWWAVATPLVYNRPISLCSADVPLLIRKIIQLATRDTYGSISPRRGKWSQCSIFFYYFWALLWPNGLIWFEVWEIMVLQIIITIIANVINFNFQKLWKKIIFFSLKLDSLTLKTHFMSLWRVSKMHFSCPIRFSATRYQTILWQSNSKQ